MPTLQRWAHRITGYWVEPQREDPLWLYDLSHTRCGKEILSKQDARMLALLQVTPTIPLT